MFQNINEGAVENENYKNDRGSKRKIEIFSNVFAIKNIPLYIISLMISMVGISGGTSPFAISVLGACISNSIPLLGIVIFAIIGTLIKSGIGSTLQYILTTLVLITSMFIVKPKFNEDDQNEKAKLAKNVFFSTFIIQFIKIAISGITLYDVLSVICFSIITAVFYKIFVNSIIVFKDFGDNKAFSIEEVLGASLMLAISVGAFGNLSIWGFSIRNILSILIVLILGWQNGILVGTTAGVTIGVTLGVITSSEPIMIAAYAISGMIAGILNRFGKIGVIVGFCLGNVILAYVSNGFTVELIHFKEILIASIGLLAVPKSMQLNIKEFMGNSKFFPIFPARALNKSKETAERLNNVSETIQEMANTYKIEDEKEEIETKSNKEIFVSELLDNLRGYEDNILYDDISNVEGPIVNEIFNTLVDKQEITRELLLKIFAKCNSYIVGFDDKKVSKYLEENISQMVNVINMSYKIAKSNFVWQKKFEENKKNLKTQLKGVSKAISNIADNIENDIKNEEKFTEQKKQIVEKLNLKDINIQEISIQKIDRFLIEIYMEKSNITDTSYISDVLTEVLGEKIVFNQEASIGTKLSFLSDDKYIMAIGESNIIKSNSKISGDSSISIKLKDGKYLVALSDGMGSGEDAKQSSTKALKMLENLLLSGFDKKTSLELINSSLINQNEEVFATLDIAIIDLYKGNIELIKSGASPTYFKYNNKVQIIKTNSLPAGIINETNLQTFDKDINLGEIMVMCTDGILDSNVEYKNKELWVKYFLEDIDTSNTKKIADMILNEAIDNGYGTAKDDMSVVVCKFLKK